MPGTVKEIFNLNDFLTARDRNANIFVTDDDLVEVMRTDCPMILPEVPAGKIESR